MTQITLKEKLIYRTVKRAAIVWLLMVRLDPQPVGEASVAEILQIDRATARKYLNALYELGLVTRQARYDGYNLTGSGRQLALPLELRQLQELAKGKISPSSAINVNESIKDSKDIKDSLLLIKREGEIFPFEGEIHPRNKKNGPACGENGESCGEPVDKLTINQMIDMILEKEPDRRQVLEALLDCRIAMNARTIELLSAPDITEQEIRSQYHQLEKRGLEDQTGILITNLESRYRPRGADFDPDTGHPVECNCYRCIGARNARFFDEWGSDPDRDKYAAWESDDE